MAEAVAAIFRQHSSDLGITFKQEGCRVEVWGAAAIIDDMLTMLAQLPGSYDFSNAGEA